MKKNRVILDVTKLGMFRQLALVVLLGFMFYLVSLNFVWLDAHANTAVAVGVDEDYLEDELFDSTCYREIEDYVNYLKPANVAVKAHIEVCLSDTYEMLYYDLSVDELVELQDALLGAEVEKDNPFAADMSTTVHLFREDNSYVYVVALDRDLETMHCEAGNVKSDKLRDILVSLRTKTLNTNQKGDY